MKRTRLGSGSLAMMAIMSKTMAATVCVKWRLAGLVQMEPEKIQLVELQILVLKLVAMGMTIIPMVAMMET